GWSLSEDGIIEFENEAAVVNLLSSDNGMITLYAQWAGYSYTVVYNANSGIGNMPNSNFSYGISKNLLANTFTRSGYVFVGWALSESGSMEFADEAIVRNLTMIEGGTVTLFAQWLPAYSIFFIANDGIPSPTSPIVISQGNKITEPPSMTKTGYTFDGWYKESDFLNKWNFTNDIPISDTTLFAKWIPVTYSVTYDKNTTDATGTTSSSNHIYNIEQNLTVNGFSRIGYKFSGWSTTSTGSVLYTNEQSVKNLGTTSGQIVIL
ncbi:InlB B-repeat-containing protein, partial [Treponema sp. R80B11-R83G3]